MKCKPKATKRKYVDEMDRLVNGTEPKAPQKNFVEYDPMYGGNIKYIFVGNDFVHKCAKSDLQDSPNAYYGALKKPEEKYDGPDWQEIVKKGELYLKMEMLEEKHGYEWGCN